MHTRKHTYTHIHTDTVSQTDTHTVKVVGRGNNHSHDESFQICHRNDSPQQAIGVITQDLFPQQRLSIATVVVQHLIITGRCSSSSVGGARRSLRLINHGAHFLRLPVCLTLCPCMSGCVSLSVCLSHFIFFCYHCVPLLDFVAMSVYVSSCVYR